MTMRSPFRYFKTSQEIIRLAVVLDICFPLLSCCLFRGHEDKIVTEELESGYDETEVQP
jgi:hypothetical protein